MVTAISHDSINKDPDLLDVHGPLPTESGSQTRRVPVTASAPLINQLLTKDHYWVADSKHLLDFFEEK